MSLSAGSTVILVSFATPQFALSRSILVRSARAHGIRCCRTWNARRLATTPFSRRYRAVLDEPRGAGYWLWKPYIIRDALERAAEGDIVVYADAGVVIVRSLAPLLALCSRERDVVLFAGHYDGAAGRPNRCGKWTKRDCFTLMACDAAHYHEAPMADAAFIVLRKSPWALRFVDQWLSYCCDARILTDSPNEGPQPNLPDFIQHRHDQSVLSLLAAKHGLELFRSPSQFGNHCKCEPFREEGEWLRAPYGSGALYANSMYGTLLFHHRKRTLPEAVVVPGRARRVFQLDAAGDSGVRRFYRRDPNSQYVVVLNGAPRRMPAAVSSRRDVIISGGATGAALATDVRRMRHLGLPGGLPFTLCFDMLEGLGGWAAFRSVRGAIPAWFPDYDVTVEFGFARPGGRHETPTTVGVVTGVPR